MAEGSMYHERQSRMFCAVHALNNLFQDPKAYTKSELDEICYNIDSESFINPHKNPLGLGNYDVNVLMVALNLKGYEAIWYNKGMSPEQLVLHNIYGFIINKLSGMKLVGIHFPVKRPHWLAIKKINGSFYNLDSKLSHPECLGDEEQLRTYLSELLRKEDDKTQLFVIVENDVYQENTWRR